MFILIVGPIEQSCDRVAKDLHAMMSDSRKHVVIIPREIIRGTECSPDNAAENNVASRNIAIIARDIVLSGGIAICAFRAPFRANRAIIRDICASIDVRIVFVYHNGLYTPRTMSRDITSYQQLHDMYEYPYDYFAAIAVTESPFVLGGFNELCEKINKLYVKRVITQRGIVNK